MKVYEQLITLKQDLDVEIAKTVDEETKDKFKRIKGRLHAITFASDDSYPGVQAADMIAYEARRAMVKRIDDPSYTSELYDKLTFARVHQPSYYTSDVIDGLRATLKESIANGTVTL